MDAATTTAEKKLIHKTFKLVFSETDIRRITVNSSSWDSFIEQIQKLYPNEFHPELRIQYVDNEGDRCTVSSQQEWDSMLELMEDESTIKLFISEGLHQGKYFKDGPPPQVEELYIELNNGEKKPVEPVGDPSKDDSFTITVPHCLQKLFPSGKILPYNLPRWLQPHVKVTKVPTADNDVYMDIDVYALFDELHKQALKRIGPDKKPKALEKAKAFLESMLALVPQHPVALYNLACTEALLGRGEAAMNALKAAVASGYTNIAHMLNDADLASLHARAEFKEWVNQVSSQISSFASSMTTTTSGEKEEKKEEVAQEMVTLGNNNNNQESEIELEAAPVETSSSTDEDDYVMIKKNEEIAKKTEEQEEKKKAEKAETEEEARRRLRKEFVPPADFKWPEQLKTMVEMGFDPEAAAEKLKKRKGKIDRAVNDLLHK
jgi:hypothetical protein